MTSVDDSTQGDSLDIVARLRQRFHGLLLGQAIGDALAAATQWARPASFDSVRDLLGGGPYDLPRGAWSDDTAMVLCMARSLVELQRSDVADQRQKLLSWQRTGEFSATAECWGITASVSTALARDHPDPTLTDGVDALLRAAPLAMFYLSDSKTLRAAVAESAAITSHSPATLMAAATWAEALQAALRGEPLERVLRRLRDSAEHPSIAAVLQIFAANTQDGAAWKVVVLAAVNRGGDSDVLASLCGQLAGATLGIESIPHIWRVAVARREWLEETADALLTEALVNLAA